MASLVEDVKEHEDVHQQSEEEIGYHSRTREQESRRNPGQCHQGTGEPGLIGHQASQTAKDPEGAQGHRSEHFPACSPACLAVHIRCRKPPLMGHRIARKSSPAVVAEELEEHQQVLDTQHQTEAADRTFQELPIHRTGCTSEVVDVLD